MSAFPLIADINSSRLDVGFGPAADSCAATKSGRFRNWLSGVQLIEQRLSLLQIERVETLGEPAVDRDVTFVA
jgi:hypothetical protein